MSYLHFSLLFPKVMNLWRFWGETGFASFFELHYGLDSACEGRWFYCASGIVPVLAQNNTSESYMNCIKGTHGPFDAPAKTLPAFFPRLASRHIAFDATLHTGLGIGKSVDPSAPQSTWPISNECLALNALMGDRDFVEQTLGTKQVFYVNLPRFYGTSITVERIAMFKKYVEGTIPNEPVECQALTVKQLSRIGLTRVEQTDSTGPGARAHLHGHFQGKTALIHSGWWCCCKRFWQYTNCPCLLYIRQKKGEFDALPVQRRRVGVYGSGMAVPGPLRGRRRRPAWVQMERRISDGDYHPVLDFFGIGISDIPEVTYLALCHRGLLFRLALLRGYTKDGLLNENGNEYGKTALLHRVLHNTHLGNRLWEFVSQRDISEALAHSRLNQSHGNTFPRPEGGLSLADDPEEEGIQDEDESGDNDEDSLSTSFEVHNLPGFDSHLDGTPAISFSPTEAAETMSETLNTGVVVEQLGASQHMHDGTQNACVVLSLYIAFDFICNGTLRPKSWIRQYVVSNREVHQMIAKVRTERGITEGSPIEAMEAAPTICRHFRMGPTFIVYHRGVMRALLGDQLLDLPTETQIFGSLVDATRLPSTIPLAYVVQNGSHAVSLVRGQAGGQTQYVLVDSLPATNDKSYQTKAIFPRANRDWEPRV